MVCEEHWWSNKCDSKGDIRYDESISPDISNLHPLFSDVAGFWFGTGKRTYGDLVTYSPDFSAPYDRSFDIASNITVSGTRFTQTDYFIHDPAPADFCAIPVPPGGKNVLDDGVCGTNGYILSGSAYRASTHEKTDLLVGVSGAGFYNVDFGPDTLFNQTMIIGSNNQLIETEYLELPSIGYNAYMTFTYTMNDDRNSLLLEQTVYTLSSGGAASVLRRGFFNMTRVDSEQEWIEMVQNSMDESKVTATTQESFPTLCKGPGCPTEATWCEVGDASPSCGPTPYTEETTVNAGLVAGLTAALAVVVIATVVFIMRRIQERKLAEQRERLKNTFAKHVIEALGIGKNASAEALTMEALMEEFKKIDSGIEEGGDGNISKAELKAFMTSGKLGDVSDSDFETLFGIIDADGSGGVDFIEFASFMGEIKSNLENFDDNGPLVPHGA